MEVGQAKAQEPFERKETRKSISPSVRALANGESALNHLPLPRTGAVKSILYSQVNLVCLSETQPVRTFYKVFQFSEYPAIQVSINL